jgi:hypothetical protein
MTEVELSNWLRQGQQAWHLDVRQTNGDHPTGGCFFLSESGHKAVLILEWASLSFGVSGDSREGRWIGQQEERLAMTSAYRENPLQVD